MCEFGKLRHERAGGVSGWNTRRSRPVPVRGKRVESAGLRFWVEHDAQAIARALLNSLSDPILAAAMGKKAQQLVRSNYSWDAAALKMVEYYSQIHRRYR